MPPRYTYWTILIGNQPTAFRAATRDELLPTLKQLQSTQPDAVMMWFARGKVWPSEEAAAMALRMEREGPRRERRGADWRPGGEHKDPRDRFKVPRDVKRQRFASRLRRDRVEEAPTPGAKTPGDRRPTGPKGFQPQGERPEGGRPFRPKGGPPEGGRPFQPKGDRPEGTRPFRTREDRPGEARPFRPKGDRPFRPKGDRPAEARPFRPSGPRGNGKPGSSYGGGGKKGGGGGRGPR